MGRGKKGKEMGFETFRTSFLNVLGLETIDETISRREGGREGGARGTCIWRT